MRGRCAGAAANDDCALHDGRVIVSRHADEMAVGLEARGECGGERKEADLGVAGVGELRSLRDVLGDAQTRLHSREEARMLERGARGAAVGSVIRVGDGDGWNRGAAQSIKGEGRDAGVIARPEDECSASVGKGLRFFGFAGVDHALREGEVGGHEEIEGGAVDDLRGEGRGGLIRGEHVDAGLLLEFVEDGWQDGLEVGGGSEAHGCPNGRSGLLRENSRRNTPENEDQSESEESAIKHGAP